MLNTFTIIKTTIRPILVFLACQMPWLPVLLKIYHLAYFQIFFYKFKPVRPGEWNTTPLPALVFGPFLKKSLGTHSKLLTFHNFLLWMPLIFSRKICLQTLTTLLGHLVKNALSALPYIPIYHPFVNVPDKPEKIQKSAFS